MGLARSLGRCARHPHGEAAVRRGSIERAGIHDGEHRDVELERQRFVGLRSISGDSPIQTRTSDRSRSARERIGKSLEV